MMTNVGNMEQDEKVEGGSEVGGSCVKSRKTKFLSRYFVFNR
jgi:hypothetical protein